MQFKDVLVDAAFKQKLIDLAREGRSAHAQFFLAQPGSHALALAVALGQYLCCENPGEHDSCGECPSCKQYAKLSHHSARRHTLPLGLQLKLHRSLLSFH